MSKTINKLFFILLLFLPSQLGKHWWPEWSLVNGVRIDYLAPTVYLTDILILILGLSILFQKTRKTLKTRYPQKIRKPEGQKFRPSDFLNFRFSGFPSIPSVLIIFLIISWILVSERKLLAGYWALRYLEIPMMAWLTIRVIREIGEIRAIKRITNILSVGILFSVGLGMAQMVLGRTTGWFWILGERSFTLADPGIATMTIFGIEILRPYATFPHPNALGGFLAAAIMMEYGVWSMEYGKWRKKLLVWVGVLGVILTGSRGAIIALMSSLVISYWVPVSASAIIGFPGESGPERVVLARAAIEMWRENWLFGVGPGQFLVKLPEYLPAGFYKIQPVHNIFLLGLAEFGVIGGGICLIGLIWLIWRIEQVRKWLPVVAVILITGMVDHYWLTGQQNRLLLGVVLGLWISGR